MGIIWEIDYYSRPILDEQGKKLWEVLICESPLDTGTKPESLFRYSQFCPSNQVNSGWLRTALQEAISLSPTPPQKVRFFRRFMNNMITKACEDAGIPVVQSRRTITLYQWMEQRMQDVYPTMPGYEPLPPNPSVQGEMQAPQSLPDALMGQQWTFVNLEAAELAQMPEWEIDFKEAFPLEMAVSAEEQAILPDTKIPGIVIFSPRAFPLAAWMSGIELACVKFERTPQPRLILETGVVDRWILANIKAPDLLQAAKKFEEAKQKAQNLHFLSIQSDPQAGKLAGFWLLKELNLS